MTSENRKLTNCVRHLLARGIFAVFLLTTAGALTAANAEYRFGSGDKLRVYVFGQKDMDHTATVDVSGKIWFPTIGRIGAANLTLDEVHQQISKILTANDTIRSEDINIEVVEFRPFYIVGAVAKPGSYPFIPGLTVRQAIALAGGLARSSSDQLGILLQGDPRSSYASLLSEYLHRMARADRFRAELDGKTSFEWEPRPGLPVIPELVKSLSELQNLEFKARAEKFEREKQDVDQLIQLAQAEVTTLEQQDERLQQEDTRVTENLAELHELKKKGVVSLARINEFQRDVFSSRYARDSTSSQLASARRQHAESVGKRAQMDFTRREEITRELSLANAELDVLKAQLTTAATRTGLSGDSICALEGKAEGIFINRQDDGRNKRFSASDDSEVKPGDTIEVNIINELLRAHCRAREAGAGNGPALRSGTP